MPVRDTKIHFNTLQLLRGMAAIAIVFFHGLLGTDIHEFVQYGNMGVHIFFVLSGFIVFYVHDSEIGVRSRLKPFLVKRLLRIFPLYWMVTLSYILLVFPFGHRFSADYILKSMLLLPQDRMPIVGAAWTLEYEVLFYLVFCLLIFNHRLLHPVFVMWIITIVFSFISPAILENSMIINTLANPLNLEFLLGSGVALLVRRNRTGFKWVPKAAIFAGVFGICLSLSISYLGYLGIHRVILWGIPSAVLIFGLVKLEYNQKVRVPRIFVYLGDASYSIYLTHLVTLLAFSKLLEKIGLVLHFVNLSLFQMISSIIAVLVGCLFHSFIERPLMKYFKDNIIRANKDSVSPAQMTKSAM